MILCTVFIVLGLFVLFFMTKRLTYELDKALNQVTLLYPARFATKHDVVTFSMGKLKGIIKKKRSRVAIQWQIKCTWLLGYDFRYLIVIRVSGKQSTFRA